MPFLLVVVAQSVILAWLYNSTTGSLPIVMIFHAAFNTYGQYLLPEFAGEHYLTMWWSMAGLYAIAATAITLYAGAERLTAHAQARRPSPAQVPQPL